jgi:hypothetical protein
MNADQLEPSSVQTDVFMQDDSLDLGNGNVWTTNSLMTNDQDQAPSEVNLETVQSGGLREVVVQIRSLNYAFKVIAEPVTTTKGAGNGSIEDGPGGDRSLDMGSSKVGYARDASASEVDNTIETQALSAAQSIPITVAQTSSSRAAAQQTDGLSEPQVDGELSSQQNTQQVPAVSVVLFDPGTARSPGKQLQTPKPNDRGECSGPKGKSFERYIRQDL